MRIAFFIGIERVALGQRFRSFTWYQCDWLYMSPQSNQEIKRMEWEIVYQKGLRKERSVKKAIAITGASYLRLLPPEENASKITSLVEPRCFPCDQLCLHQIISHHPIVTVLALNTLTPSSPPPTYAPSLDIQAHTLASLSTTTIEDSLRFTFVGSDPPAGRKAAVLD